MKNNLYATPVSFVAKKNTPKGWVFLLRNHNMTRAIADAEFSSAVHLRRRNCRLILIAKRLQRYQHFVSHAAASGYVQRAKLKVPNSERISKQPARNARHLSEHVCVCTNKTQLGGKQAFLQHTKKQSKLRQPHIVQLQEIAGSRFPC